MEESNPSAKLYRDDLYDLSIFAKNLLEGKNTKKILTRIKKRNLSNPKLIQNIYTLSPRELSKFHKDLEPIIGQFDSLLIQ